MQNSNSYSSSPATIGVKGSKRWVDVVACFLILSCFHSARTDATDDATPTRELYVPFEDLPSILSGPNERIFMPRTEFELLKAAAEKKPKAISAPRDALLVSTDFEVSIANGYSTIVGLIDVEVMVEGVVLQPLEMSNVSIRQATLDDAPAALAINEHGVTMLVAQGVGRHRLRLEMSTSVESKEAQQTIQLRLPNAASNRLRLLVQGNVEIKSGVAILSREYNNDTDSTRFDVVPSQGPMSIVTTLNNKQLRDQHVVVARSVIVDEVSQTDEKLVATFSMNVLNGGSEEFQYAIPAGFEVQDVSSPQMSRWNVEGEEGKRTLNVMLRETITERCVVGITLMRSRQQAEPWEWPRIEPLDVEGHVAVLGLRAESRIQISEMETKGLIALDDSILANALPNEMQQVGAGAIQTRFVGTFYAPHRNFEWTASFASPPPGLATTMSLVLRIGDGGLDLLGGLAFSPTHETLFAFDLMVPKDWQVLDINLLDGTPVRHHRYETKDGSRVHVTLATPIRAMQKQDVVFTAKHTPQGWLDPWEQQSLDFPKIRVQAATHSQYALAVQVDEDLSVESKVSNNLMPMFENEKARFRLEKVTSSIAYQTTLEEWGLNMQVTRTKPRLTARWHSFIAFRQEGLAVHYEAAFNVEQARTREVAFSLPASTPAELTIAGIGDIVIKETSSSVIDDRRIWKVKLAKACSGRIGLSIDFQQPLPSEEPKSFKLPQARAENVIYQSGVTAIEGDPDFEFQITQHPPFADVGQLVDAKYQVGKHLLGTFAYVGLDDEVVIDIERRSGYMLPSTIVKRAELTTIVSDHGISQTAARYSFQSKDDYLEVVLPAGSQLWSVMVDHIPSLPQLDGERLVVEFPKSKNSTEIQRDLQIVYQMPITKMMWRSQINVTAPKLVLRQDGKSSDREVPVADVQWHLWVPQGNKLVDNTGNVFCEQKFSEDWVFTDVARHRYGADILAADYSDGTSMTFERQGINEVVAGTSVKSAVESKPKERTADAKDFSKTKQSTNSTWAMAGVRSLPIEINADKSFEHYSFSSLGEEPHLSATLIARQRSQFATWLIGLAVFIGGLFLIKSSSKSKWRYLLLVLAFALLLPSLTPWSIELQPMCVAALLSSGCLVFTYIFVSFFCWTRNFWSSRINRKPVFSSSDVVQTISIGLIASCVVCNGFLSKAIAQPPAIFTPEKLMSLIEALPSKSPISIPADSIVVPYRPDQDSFEELMAKPDDELWIAMPTYVEMWKRAHPQIPLTNKASPIAWAWRGVEYSAKIEEDLQLRLKGHLQVENFSDEVQTIPLPLHGGVLKSASLDEQPAHLKDDGNGLQILIAGRGSHTILLDMSFPIQKQGGWRMLQGRVPVAPASQVKWTIAKAGTEIRLPSMLDRVSRETNQPNEEFSVPVANDGSLSIQWRPKLSEATVDQGLSTDSMIFLDVQDDGLRLVWNVDLAFRTGRRDAFRFEIPADYLVERVIGPNIRGWNVDKSDDRQRVDVQLLKSAAEHERITIVAARRSIFEKQDAADFDAPVCQVEDAMLQQGTLIIRRSSLLEIRAENIKGLSRRDMPDNSSSNVEAVDESPLGIRPFQAFRFSTVPYSMKIVAEAIQPNVAIETQTVLRLSANEASFESRLMCRVADRPLYHLQVLVPEGWDIERPALPCDFEWTLKSTSDGNQKIDIRLKSGQSGDFSLILLGRSLTRKNAGSQTRFPLPEIQVLNVKRQEGHIVVQTDPGYDVRSEELQNCEAALMSQVESWLSNQQRTLARTVVHYRSSPYSGFLQIVPRVPVVNGLAISNVKITDRIIEETVYIDWTIRDAGVHQFSFTLPAWMNEARVRAPLIQRITKTTLGKADDSPIQFVLDLQDDVIGQYRVVIENDRPIGRGPQLAPIPSLKTGTTDQRFVTLENVGEDELTIGKQTGLDLLDRLQSQWKILSDLLGGKAAQAYWIREGGEDPMFEYSIQDRAKVKTADGRIGLAQTILILDEAGAYRGSQEYRVENRTEQYLEIEMPSGANLWTAEVAGEPVKPIQIPTDTNAGTNTSNRASTNQANRPYRVRLPLIKTDDGDLDYGVIVKYGGRLNVPDNWNSLAFPLIRTVNINVELSQVRLLVPDSRRWYNFSGSLRRVNDSGDFAAGWLSFKNKQVEQLTELLSSSSQNAYSRSRATANLKVLESTFNQKSASINSLSGTNTGIQTELQRNTESRQKAQTVVLQNANTDVERMTVDNRGALNAMSTLQHNGRANNVVGSQTYNFQGQPQAASNNGGQLFNQSWLNNNSIGNVQTDQTSQSAPHDDLFAAKQQQKQSDLGVQPQSAQNQPMAIDLSKSYTVNGFRTMEPNEQARSNKADSSGEASQALRYQQAIEQKANSAGGRLALSNANGLSTTLPAVTAKPQANFRFDSDQGASASILSQGTVNVNPNGNLYVGGTIVSGGVLTPAPASSPAPVPTQGLQASAVAPEEQIGYRASLSLELTERGREYLFTTPRGNIELSARSFASNLQSRMQNLGLSLLVLACLWSAPRLLQSFYRGKRVRASNRTISSWIGDNV